MGHVIRPPGTGNSHHYTSSLFYCSVLTQNGVWHNEDILPRTSKGMSVSLLLSNHSPKKTQMWRNPMNIFLLFLCKQVGFSHIRQFCGQINIEWVLSIFVTVIKWHDLWKNVMSLQGVVLETWGWEGMGKEQTHKCTYRKAGVRWVLLTL